MRKTVFTVSIVLGKHCCKGKCTGIKADNIKICTREKYLKTEKTSENLL